MPGLEPTPPPQAEVEEPFGNEGEEGEESDDYDEDFEGEGEGEEEEEGDGSDNEEQKSSGLTALLLGDPNQPEEAEEEEEEEEDEDEEYVEEAPAVGTSGSKKRNIDEVEGGGDPDAKKAKPE